MITQKIIARTDSLKLDKIISRYGEDSMRQVVFIIVRPDPDSEELIPITIPEDAVGSFRILKPSGNFVIVPMSKSVLASGETAFDVVLPVSANTAKGSGYYDIRITSETDKYYFTAQGDFIIDDNIISDEVLEDVSEVNGLIFPDDFLTVEDHVAYIDDDVTSTESTWSSNKISEEIEAHAGGDVSKTVSGNPVTFTDGAFAPLVKCVTEIQGSQDLHGYEKPWVGGAGKNKLPMTVSDIKTLNTSGTWSGNDYKWNGVTYSIITDNGENITGINVNGTASALSYLLLQNSTNDFSVFAGKSCILNGCPANGSLSAYTLSTYGSGMSANDVGNGANVTFPSTTPNAWNIAINIISGYTANNLKFYPMLRLSTETDPTFAPYSNICPISGYSSVGVNVAGKNLIWRDNTSYNIYNGGHLIPVASGDTIWFYGEWTGGSLNARLYDSVNETDKNNYTSQIRSIQLASSGTVIVISIHNDGYLGIAYNGSVASYTIDKMMVTKTEITPSDYEPYAGHTYTIALGDTYYSGQINVVKGVLVADKVGAKISDFDFSAYSTPNNHVFRATYQNIIDIPNYSRYVVPPIISGAYNVNSYNALSASDNGMFAVSPHSENRFVIIDHNYSTVNDFLTAMGNTVFVFSLDTPLEIPLTPTVISSLLGNNTMWTDGDSMVVEYITQRFQPLIDSIAQL